MPLAKSINILAGAPKALVDQLFAKAQPRDLASGQALFEAGDAGDGCYRLDHGLVKVVVLSPQSEERILTVLGPGAIVGELAMIDGLPRSASVVAVTDCVFTFVSRREFDRFTTSHPKLLGYLVKT